MAKMTVKFIKQLNTLVIKNEDGRGLFISTVNSLIISIGNLATLLRFLVFNNFLSVKVLEGLIEEYYTFKGNTYYENDFLEIDND
jgi:hypothetical protein